MYQDRGAAAWRKVGLETSVDLVEEVVVSPLKRKNFLEFPAVGDSRPGCVQRWALRL